MEPIAAFKALGDATRYAIFTHLLERPHCVRSLSRQVGITESAVSQHLKLLRETGLVYGEKYGYHTHYFPNRAALEELRQITGAMVEKSANLNREPDSCQCQYKGGEIKNEHSD